MAGARRKGRQHRHTAACQHHRAAEDLVQVPENWPSGLDIAKVYPLAPVAAARLGAVSVDDVFTVLGAMPATARSYLLRNIGLSNARSVNRGMAGQLLARLRADSDPATSPIARGLVAPLLALFEDEQLDRVGWERVCGSDDTLAMAQLLLAEATADTWWVAEHDLPASLRELGLVVAIATETPAAAAALSFLAARDEDAARAHAALAAEHSDMPPRAQVDFAQAGPTARALRLDVDLGADGAVSRLPESLRRQLEALLEDGAAPSDLDGAAEADDPDVSDLTDDDLDVDDLDMDDLDMADFEGEDLNGLDDEGRPVGAITVDVPAGDPAGPLPGSGEASGHAGGHRRTSLSMAVVAEVGLAGLVGRWDQVTAAAARMHADLADGHVPAEDDLDELSAFLQELYLYAPIAAEYRAEDDPAPAPVASRDNLVAAHARLRAFIAARHEPWREHLARLTGPQEIAGQLDRVRQLAGSAQTGSQAAAALRALHRLVELGVARRAGDPVDFGEVTEAEATARAGLPQELHQVVLAAAFGTLALDGTAPADTSRAPASDPHGPTRTAAPSAGAAGEADTTDEHPTGEPATTDQGELSPEQAQQPEQQQVEQQGAEAAQPAEPAAKPMATPAVADVPTPAGTGADSSSSGLAPHPEPTQTPSGGPAGDPTSAPASLAQPALDLSALDRLLSGPAGARLHAAGSTATDRSTSTDGPAAGGPGSDAPTHPAADPSDQPGRDVADRPRAITTSPRAADTAAAAEAGQAGVPDPLPAAEVDLLPAARFGLAADLAAAGGATPASVHARELAALALALRAPTGPIAAQFSTLASSVTREALSDDRGGQLLAWAAAVRVAVLAPSAGSASLLADLGVCVEDQPALAEVGQAFAAAARAGVVVLPEAADAVSTLAGAEERAGDLAAKAAETIASAPTRPIKYIPANAVYQTWMNPDGILGSLLGLVAQNDPAHIDQVRSNVLDLRGRADKQVEATFSQQRRNPSNKITGGARNTLRQRYDDAIDLAADWADAASDLARTRSRLHTDRNWQATPLAALRQRVADLRGRALDELTTLGMGAGGSDPTVQAASAAAFGLLTEAFDTCNGKPPTGAEPSPAYAQHAELLASDLLLDATTLTPDEPMSSPRVRAALVALTQDAPADPVSVYERRAARGDHDLTAVLIGGLRTADPGSAAALARRRDSDVQTAAQAAADTVRALLTTIDARRMDGALTEHTWSAAAARAAALDEAARVDYGRIRAQAASIQGDIDTERAHLIEQALARISARAETLPEVAANLDKLTELVVAGRIAGADEYLQQLTDPHGVGALPDIGSSAEHLARFYPAVCAAAADHPRLPEALHARLSGRDLGADVAASVAAEMSAALAAFTDVAGADLDALSQRRREDGAHALGAWAALRRRSKAADVTGAVKVVLAQAGLEFAGITVEAPVQDGERQWVTLTGVNGTGLALTPTLGSAMSPDARTLRVLLVRSAPTPATVIEWMSREPADHTVLALWLPGALSCAERRSVANAARGRNRPPVLVMDTAALAYLAVQPEPRRSTLAAITLPFTAVSPFRDTPGDTAPEMFYGRTEERRDIMDLSGPSFVSGGRQLGKSALLRDAQRRFDDGEHRRAVLTSIFTLGGAAPPERLWSMLWPHLAALGVVPAQPPVGADTDGDLAAAVRAGILTWLGQHPANALLILLDEADAFLDADARGNRFANVDACRELMLASGRRVKVVFAGLHRTARFESLPNQPLSHFGAPVSVGPLRPQHAYDLLTRPLAALGLTFADPVATPARVLAWTNNMPALLQLFGEALVKHLTARPVEPGQPPTLITDEDVETVFANPSLRARFREKYVLTLNLDHRYLVIAYTVAQAAYERGIDASMTLAELSETCRAAWPAGFAGCGADDFRGLVTECVDLGVLAVDRGAYRMRTPTVLRLLGTEEEVLETLYFAAENLAVPSPGDAVAFRRPLRGTSTRFPLTEAQLGRVFGRGSAVVLVTGSPALGIDRVPAALEQVHQDEAGLVHTFKQVNNTTPTGLRNAATMLPAGSAMLLLDARRATAGQLEDLLGVAEEVIGSRVDPTRVVLVAGIDSAPAWAGRGDRVELVPIEQAGLRLWFDDAGVPAFREEADRHELLAAAGGWPKLLRQVATSVTADPGTAAEAVEALRDRLGTAKVAGELLDSVLGEGALGPLLRHTFAGAAELFGIHGEDPAALSAYLVELWDGDLPAKAAAAGFADLGEVIRTLSALGALRVDEHGRLRAEPVLATALAAANAPGQEMA